MFDLDDTLLDHGKAMRQAVDHVHAAFRLAASLDEFHRNWSDASERHYSRYLAGEISFAEQRRARVRDAVGQGLSVGAVDEILGQFIAEYERRWILFDDVLPCLQSLSGFRLGLLSNGAAREQRRKLASLGLLSCFEIVLTSEEAGAAKPDAAIFLRACEALGVAPAEAIYVGDRCDLDAVAARRAGLDGVWLNRRRKGHPLAATVNAIAGLDELAPLLRERARKIIGALKLNRRALRIPPRPPPPRGRG
ncbi:HAD family hydrolase [Rhodoblastus sp.]|uniref:HAD family hydrolase n=1 Tax=Rhodoblastus sp. TaxID=1962975 RepID=UPI0025F2C377|nr:HAD family hydrolase [Rhodoblastus sp.]